MASRTGRRQPVEKKSLVDSRTQALGAPPAWARQVGDAVLIQVHARPGARVAAVVGRHGDRLKVAVDAPPVDGKANDALLKLIAKVLERPRAQVELQAGATHRDKTVRVANADALEIASRISALMPANDPPK